MKCAKLIKVLGYKGYGVFWSVIELMNEQSDCQLPVDFETLGWQLHINAKFLERVVREFDLFRFSEDGSFFWSEAARRRLEMRRGVAPVKNPTGKRGRPAKNAGNVFPQKSGEVDRMGEDVVKTSETAQKCAATDVVNNLSSETQNSQETPKENEIRDSEQKNFEEYAEDVQIGSMEPNLGEKVIELWNKTFEGTKRKYRGLQLDAVSYGYLDDATKNAGFTLEEIQEAFQAARNDDFAWLLRDVLKKENIQRLLTKKEMKKNGTNDFTAGKQYFDTDGNPVQPGAEFVSPEYWSDARAAGAIGF